MSNLYKRKIRISSLEEKQYGDSTKINITDEKKLKYGFFKTKVDGTSTKAFEGWETRNLGVGDVVGIAFDQTEKEYQGNKYQQRDIKFFEEAEGIEYSSENKDLLPQPNLIKEKKEVDWDAVSRGKVRNSVVTAFIPLIGNKKLTSENIDIMETWVDYIMLGEKNEIKLEDIPFRRLL